MQAKEILEELKALGSDNIRNIYTNHGAQGTYWGVKIGDMKPIQKKIKKNYELSKELYKSGVSDAMYFAGLIADEKKMTKADLTQWAKTATWHMISEYTVAWIAAESNHGWELALEWIESPDEKMAISGWSTLASVVSLKKDDDLDIAALRKLLQRVVKDIHDAPNYVRYAMNAFVIALGVYVAALTDEAIEAGKKIGKVHVTLGNTACKVPFSPDYIAKVAARGSIGKKKKMARC